MESEAVDCSYFLVVDARLSPAESDRKGATGGEEEEEAVLRLENSLVFFFIDVPDPDPDRLNPSHDIHPEPFSFLSPFSLEAVPVIVVALDPPDAEDASDARAAATSEVKETETRACETTTLTQQ
jgi:hypothetical protein